MDEIGFFFVHKDTVYQLPINPEELKVQFPGDNKSVTLTGPGEYTILQKRKLAKVSVASWLPETDWFAGIRTSGQFKTAKVYDDLFKSVMENEEYMRFIVTGIDINMLVSVESYDSRHEAGDHEDIYFSLSLKEYKPQQALVISTETTALLSVGGGSNGNTSVSTQTRFTVGSLCLARGPAYPDTNSNDSNRLISRATVKVTYISVGGLHPYQIASSGSGTWIGWVDESTLRLST